MKDKRPSEKFSDGLQPKMLALRIRPTAAETKF